MLTLFAVPKKFHGHVGIIQRNAVISWTKLKPRPEILLMGKDEGTAEIAAELNLRHIPDIACNSYGTPLVPDFFQRAKELASGDTLCYVNSDIILMDDFVEAVDRLKNRKKFLMVGRRWDLDIEQAFSFADGWQAGLRTDARNRGTLHNEMAMDYFVFPRDILWQMPEFAIGRPAWDNWMIYRARTLGLAVVDATEAVMAVHQNHDYRHLPTGEAKVLKGDLSIYGPEGDRNRDLGGSSRYRFSLLDATHLLTSRGLRRATDYVHLRRHFDSWQVVHPSFTVPMRLLDRIFIKPLGPLVRRIRRVTPPP